MTSFVDLSLDNFPARDICSCDFFMLLCSGVRRGKDCLSTCQECTPHPEGSVGQDRMVSQAQQSKINSYRVKIK